MNRIVSQAIKKAVSEYSEKTPQEINKEKRPDLFSLNNNTESVSYTHLTLPTKA